MDLDDVGGIILSVVLGALFFFLLGGFLGIGYAVRYDTPLMMGSVIVGADGNAEVISDDLKWGESIDIPFHTKRIILIPVEAEKLLQGPITITLSADAGDGERS